MNKIILALSSALAYAFYNASMKEASGHINHFVGAAILQLTAVLVGVLAILYTRPELNLNFQSKGLIWSIAAGVFVGLAEITMFIVFSKGLSISAGTAIITGGTVIFGVIIGTCIFKEMLSLQQFIGIIAIVLGIYLLKD